MHRAYFLIPIFLVVCLASCGRMHTSPSDESVGVLSFTISVYDVQRQYLVHTPEFYDRTKKYPVVIMFHGGGGTATGVMRETGWNDKADKEGFLAVYPEGTPPDSSRPGRFRDNPQTWNDGSWRSNVGAATRGIPDIKFVSAMLTDLKTHFSVDEHRVYVSGFSNGASMAFRVGRKLSNVIAAIAPVAGADWSVNTKPKRPVPLMYITGTADPLNPINGGEVRIGRKTFGEKQPVQDMIKNWIKLHGSSSKGRFVYNSDGEVGVAYARPGQMPDVVLYTIEGHGHHWPGGDSALPTFLVGKNTANLNATDVIWDFFKTRTLDDK